MLKIRTLPTCPVHAVLDELLGYRDYVFNYIPESKSGHIHFGKRDRQSEIWRPRNAVEKGKNKIQAESTRPANGQTNSEGSQAKAFFHEERNPRAAWTFKRQPKTGPNSRMGSINPTPQNLHKRGSSSDCVICLNQSRNFNFKMAGNSKGSPKTRRACWSLRRQPALCKPK